METQNGLRYGGIANLMTNVKNKQTNKQTKTKQTNKNKKQQRREDYKLTMVLKLFNNDSAKLLTIIMIAFLTKCIYECLVTGALLSFSFVVFVLSRSLFC